MHSGRKIKIEAPIAISGVLIFVLALLALVLPALAAPVAEVVIGDASAYPTETKSIPIIINNAENVGVVDLNLRYDPSVVRVIDVAGGDFDTTIPNLEHKDNGSVRIGAFQTDNPGLNKSVITIARITLEAVGNAGSTSTLDIIVNEFKDATPEGKHIDYTTANGKFTVKSSNGDSDSGDGGSRGGGYVPTTPTPSPTEKPPAVEKAKIISSIEAGKPESVTFEGLDICKISIEVDKNVSDVNVIVEKVDKPEEITDAPGIVYLYYNITATNITNVNVTATIEFKMNKSWMADENVDEVKIKLYRYDEGWETLHTSKINEDHAYIYFSVETQGLSIFAISGSKKVEVITTPSPTLAPSITPSSTTQTPTPTPVPVPRTPPLFLILIVIAVIVIAGIIIIVMRR